MDCDNTSCPLCRQQVVDLNNEQKTQVISLEQMESQYGEIQACPCCASMPWSCEAIGCPNRICDCLEYQSPFFKARNPIEYNPEINQYTLSKCEFRCIECYKIRDRKAMKTLGDIDINGEATKEELEELYQDMTEELHNIYYADTFDNIEETRCHLTHLITATTINT
jgi:hypothetical protein